MPQIKSYHCFGMLYLLFILFGKSLLSELRIIFQLLFFAHIIKSLFAIIIFLSIATIIRILYKSISMCFLHKELFRFCLLNQLTHKWFNVFFYEIDSVHYGRLEIGRYSNNNILLGTDINVVSVYSIEVSYSIFIVAR